MKVVVCGAGIAGLAVAARLQHHGHEVLVVERRPAARAGGYMIDFNGVGFDEAERLGLLPDLARIHYPVQELVLLDRDGRSVARLPYPRMRQRWFGGRHFNFLRGELEDVLLRRVSPRTVQFGLTVWSVSPAHAGVRVGLSDGTYVDADLLVGADGVHSRVRALAFGAEDQFVRPLGYESAAYLIDRPSHDPTDGNIVMLNVPGRQVAVYPVRGGFATFFLRRTWGRRGGPATSCQRLRGAYGDLGWVVPEILRDCGRANHVYLDQVAQVVMPAWHTGRVVLVGDACGAVSLLAGQGASIALHSGTVLADVIADSPSVETGLVQYEQRVKPLVDRLQRSGRTLGPWLVPETPLRIALRNAFMRMSLTPVLAPLVRRQMAG